MYTAIRKILYLPKFFAFFSIKIDSLTLKVMTTPYFAQFFLPFLALKLIHLFTLKVMNTPYFAHYLSHKKSTLQIQERTSVYMGNTSLEISKREIMWFCCIKRGIKAKGPYFNYVSTFLSIFDRLSTLVSIFTTLPDNS